MHFRRFIYVLVFLFAANTAFAQHKPTIFTVFLNDIAYSQTGNVRPCYPVMARFEHPDPAVTRVRMEYPYNSEMFMHFPVNKDVHIKLHEEFMRAGQLSLSHFIAEDDKGNRYGQMTLTFIPVDPAHGEICDMFLGT